MSRPPDAQMFHAARRFILICRPPSHADKRCYLRLHGVVTRHAFARSFLPAFLLRTPLLSLRYIYASVHMRLGRFAASYCPMLLFAIPPAIIQRLYHGHTLPRDMMRRRRGYL